MRRHLLTLPLALLLSSCSIETAAQEERGCLPTTPDVEGPFFVSDAPSTEAIAPEEEMLDPADAVLITGTVRDAATCEPVSDALVEVWYAGGGQRE